MKILPIVWLLCLLCLVSGCIAARRGSPPLPAEQQEDGAPQSVPPGMRLGASYISALGESCYEVLAGQAPAPGGRALCLRQRGWELLPPIYMDMPTASQGRGIQGP